MARIGLFVEPINSSGTTYTTERPFQMEVPAALPESLRPAEAGSVIHRRVAVAAAVMSRTANVPISNAVSYRWVSSRRTARRL